MSFEADLKAFQDKVHQRSRDIFVGSVVGVKGSIADGSPVTSAPGQPRDTSNLWLSWKESFESDWVGLVASYNVAYAISIENGQQAPYPHYISGKTVTPRPIQFGKSGGGMHSVKLTRAGWQPLVNSVVREVVGR